MSEAKFALCAHIEPVCLFLFVRFQFPFYIIYVVRTSNGNTGENARKKRSSRRDHHSIMTFCEKTHYSFSVWRYMYRNETDDIIGTRRCIRKMLSVAGEVQREKKSGNIIICATHVVYISVTKKTTPILQRICKRQKKALSDRINL